MLVDLARFQAWTQTQAGSISIRSSRVLSLTTKMEEFLRTRMCSANQPLL